MDINNLHHSASDKMRDFSGNSGSIELCKIEKVYLDRMTVKAYFLNSRVTRDNVPFTFPYFNQDVGILFVPEVGSIGIAAWKSKQEPIIISFTTLPINLNNNLSYSNPHFGDFAVEPLTEGELLLQSSGRSFIKLNGFGDIMLSTPRFTYLNLDGDTGSLEEHCERYLNESEASIEYRGPKEKADGSLVPFNTGLYYTTEVQKIFETTDNNISVEEEKEPILEIHKGTVFQGDNIVSRDAQLCYRIKVLNSSGIMLSAIDIDKEGKIYLDGNVEIIGNVSITGSLSLNGNAVATVNMLP